MSLPAADPAELAAALGPASSRLVALDFDGVLSPIVEHPDAARPTPGVVPAVEALAGRTEVAIVSGRPLADLRDRLGDLPVTWAGGHGAEVVHLDGSVDHLVDASAGTEVLDAVESDLAVLLDDRPGWLIERKPASLAVHHRLADPGEVDELLPRVQARMEARAGQPEGLFTLLSGKAVLELRPSGADKGRALVCITDRHPDLRPLVLGDDTTDEDAFLVALERGGDAVLIAETARETAANNRLASPEHVVTFIEALASTDR